MRKKCQDQARLAVTILFAQQYYIWSLDCSDRGSRNERDHHGNGSRAGATDYGAEPSGLIEELADG
jgi:hypothetical protein